MYIIISKTLLVGVYFILIYQFLKNVSYNKVFIFAIFTPIFRRHTNLTDFGDRKSQLIFCFLKDNFKKIKNIKLKKWQIKIL